MKTIYQNWIKPLSSDVRGFVLDTLFPITCISCGETEGKFLCDYCKMTAARIEQQRCIVCHKPSIGGITHPGCASPQKPDGLISLFDYHDDKISKTIIQGKYSFLPGVYRELATMAASLIQTKHEHLTKSNFSLAPIPLSKSRLRWRGFNQANVFCDELGQQLGMPVIQPLIRTRSTKTQKDLNRDDRIKNMQDAFALSYPSSPGEGRMSRAKPRDRRGRKIDDENFDIKNKNLILVDDVITTGSTLLEAVKILKRNGAGKVWCLIIARD